MINIFVFGSNLAGIHGAGSALEARRFHGAIYGQGVGPQGNSYAIPTKSIHFKTLPLATIQMFVERFRLHASVNPEKTFNVVAIGCGLAGYTPEEIAPMFAHVPGNVKLPPEFKRVLGHE